MVCNGTLQSLKISFSSKENGYFWGRRVDLRMKQSAKSAGIMYHVVYPNCPISSNDSPAPHMNLLENCGRFIGELTFSTQRLLAGNSKSRDKAKLARGYFLDHIFKHCPNLNRLVLEQSNLHNCNPKMVISKSVKELELCHVKLHRDILPQVSARLPSLDVLILARSQFEDADKRFARQKSIVIYMKNTSLEKLCLVEPNNWSSDKWKTLILVFERPGKDNEYYLFEPRVNFASDGYEFAPSNEEEFIASTKVADCRFIRIIYRSISSFMLILDNG